MTADLCFFNIEFDIEFYCYIEYETAPWIYSHILRMRRIFVAREAKMVDSGREATQFLFNFRWFIHSEPG